MNANGARAVLFDHYGGRDVLYVADVPMPTPAAGEVVVAVKAAGINPGEAAIRSGALRDSRRDEQRYVAPGAEPAERGVWVRHPRPLITGASRKGRSVASVRTSSLSMASILTDGSLRQVGREALPP
jgi:hypothetical protein